MLQHKNSHLQTTETLREYLHRIQECPNDFSSAGILFPETHDIQQDLGLLCRCLFYLFRIQQLGRIPFKCTQQTSMRIMLFIVLVNIAARNSERKNIGVLEDKQLIAAYQGTGLINPPLREEELLRFLFNRNHSRAVPYNPLATWNEMLSISIAAAACCSRMNHPPTTSNSTRA